MLWKFWDGMKIFHFEGQGFSFFTSIGYYQLHLYPFRYEGRDEILLEGRFFIKALGRGGGREPAYKAFES